MIRKPFTRVLALMAALGVSAQTAPIWAQQLIELDGIIGEQTSLPLNRFPGDHFTPTQLRQFSAQRIRTAGDLIAADAETVGRILAIQPRQARMLQRQLREAMSSR